MDNPKRGWTGRAGGRMVPIASALLAALCLELVMGCSSFTPSAITSPDPSGNVPPTLTVLEPNENLAVSQDNSFIIRWQDSDPDDNARIDIDLVQIDGLGIFIVAGGLFENDTNSDLFEARITADVPVGLYFLRMTIDDGINTPVVVFAEEPIVGDRVQINVSARGTGVQNLPPKVFVSDPQTNVGASQNDLVTVTIRPRQDFIPLADAGDPGEAFHYDREDPVDVTVLLDFDTDPNNDDLTVEEGPGHIVLEREFIGEGVFQPIDFDITINVDDVPVRQDGTPYFIRATIGDGLNISHSYAAGRLHVLRLVEGSAGATRQTVDLGQVGKTLAGVRWLGFNPLANLGSKMTSAMDQDNDGIGDFIVVAQFGNPRNRGNIGEAYLVYGRRLRFGGEININSVATDVPDTSVNRVRGSIFTPHPEFIDFGVIDIDQGDDRRIGLRPITEPYTLGIADVIAIRNLGTHPDIDGCAIPELLFGMPHNDYLATTRDDDMGDDPEDMFAAYFYPDSLPNNYCTDTEPEDDPSVFTRYAEAGSEFAIEERMGTVALWYGENNLDPNGVTANCQNNTMTPTKEIFSLTSCGAEPMFAPPSVGQPAGARFNAAIYDNYGANDNSPPPRGRFDLGFRIDPLNEHYGMKVGVLQDIDLNGFDEIIVSAPRNELDVSGILSEFGEAHPHIQSRLSRGNITVWLGQDFSQLQNAEDESHQFPFLSTRPANPGSCSADTPVSRTLETQYDNTVGGDVTVERGWFRIIGEKPSDKLGGAASAGDFNLDGPADILCGAPFADPRLDLDNNGIPESNVLDAGKVYILYSRFPFGNVSLPLDGDSAEFRPPMLRIFGEGPFDHLGLKQESGQDVNGDAIDDVFIASQDYNGQGRINNGMVSIVFGGQRIDGDRVVTQIATTELNGTRIYGTNDGDLFGADVSPAGDFNQDGLGDLLVSAPGETVTLPGEDKARNGVAYLIFGGGHLINRVFTANQVGTEALPGIVFVGPYQLGTPDTFELDELIFVVNESCDPDPDGNGIIDDFECLCDPEIYEFDDCEPLGGRDAPTLRRIDDGAPTRVGFIGDVNDDGFDDIMIGNPTADFVDPTQPGTARRSDAGEAYLIYGNNFGANNLGGQ